MADHKEQFDIVSGGFTYGGKRQKKANVEPGGLTYSNVSNASTLYGMDKFNTPRGHGFAAERANHLYDRLHGQDARLVGDDNALHGPDRVVNGIAIQSKYCSTGSKCIAECFENGRLKYINPDGSPMCIEVPSDKYDAAVQAMENRIQRGEVQGVSDPSKAKDIVQKGHFTYEQAKNIAKAGNIDSLKFDSVVLASQLSKAGLNSMMVGSSEAIVGIMGPKASAMLANAFRSGTNIYGAAAMKSAAKLLRGNVVTGAVSVVVLSTFDIVNIFRGRISGSQLFKNVANTASTVAGGTAGWVGGATAGAAIGSEIPVVGTTIGGLIGGIAGSIVGGTVTGKASKAVLDQFIEDDANEMVRIIQSVFGDMASDYLLSQGEAERIVEQLGQNLTGNTLKDMYASSNRYSFAMHLLVPLVEDEVKKRRKISIPTNQQITQGLRKILENLADAQARSY